MIIRKEITEPFIGAAIEVHRVLGRGLMESVYEECMCKELELRGIEYLRQMPLPVTYKGHRIECDLRLDIVSPGQLILELKAVRQLVDEHTAQVLGYLRASRLEHAMLINFGAPVIQFKKFILNETAA